ncbi:purine-cytosine permease FCY21 [Colletotrichum simmondsii]|uniref:Purine-cytosine permease FCY21 n=1 Tax=Colletotrichum simmondsii TaxID=703756 RepID=A0A135T261_9PEZI|nr:purine-cytosine permease FCY21 [Colletotrichum simmondsii]
MLGPSLFGLNLRDSSLVILFFTLVSALAPALLATLGPKTGMRSMIQARCSFGSVISPAKVTKSAGHCKFFPWLAIDSAIINVLGWQEAYGKALVGGVLAAILSPAGGFGEFVVVVLAFTLLGNVSGTLYTITLDFQTLAHWLVRVPRYIFSVIVTAIIIPVAIKAADDFFLNLKNFVALIGYWSTSFVGIVLVQDFLFRKGDPKLYNYHVSNVSSGLPSGAAVLRAGILCFGLIIPCMAQAWWTGPIAATMGDIGSEVAFILSAIFYLHLT